MGLDEMNGRAQSELDSAPYISVKPPPGLSLGVPPRLSAGGLTLQCLIELAVNDSALSCMRSKALLERLDSSGSMPTSAPDSSVGRLASMASLPSSDSQEECHETSEHGELPDFQPSQANVAWQPMTLAVRKLPNAYTQQMLLGALNQAGFAYTYDFVYLPMLDSHSFSLPRQSLGHAYINFVHPIYAQRFKESVHRQPLPLFKVSDNVNTKVLIGEARLQGFKANYAHYLHARVNHNKANASARPLFLREPTDEELQGLGAKFTSGVRGRSRRNITEHSLCNSVTRSDIDRAVQHQSDMDAEVALPEDWREQFSQCFEARWQKLVGVSTFAQGGGSAWKQGQAETSPTSVLRMK
ncbi:unnamed protein product [Polarella glacialis]|uniref:Mei2-like C-terminal RNA recognition motif domain-containing protein n=1 Tax=Polarella glacialis TaxID=89957 RepID=A0A813FHW7_POLGL|nr:unnamed protein product [Polarella glacialis]